MERLYSIPPCNVCTKHTKSLDAMKYQYVSPNQFDIEFLSRVFWEGWQCEMLRDRCSDCSGLGYMGSAMQAALGRIRQGESEQKFWPACSCSIICERHEMHVNNIVSRGHGKSIPGQGSVGGMQIR